MYQPTTVCTTFWTPRGTIASLREVVEAMNVDRRNFVVLTGTGLTAFAHGWLLDPERVAAAVRLDSQDKRTLLAEFRTAAQPYADTSQIKDFDAKFADLLWPASA